MSKAQDLLAAMQNADDSVEDHRDGLQSLAQRDDAVGAICQSLLNNSGAET